MGASRRSGEPMSRPKHSRRTAANLAKAGLMAGFVALTPMLRLTASAESEMTLPPEEIQAIQLAQSQSGGSLQTPRGPVKEFLQSLDYNRDEATEIVTRNAESIRADAKLYNVPDWMIATVIYVETAQGLPGAWRWNDAASRDLFVNIGRPTSMGVMQVRQDPEELGLETHWQRMMFASDYEQNESWQIDDGARHLQAVLNQQNRLGGRDATAFQWSTHKLAVVAHEYNVGPSNWRGTEWEEAIPNDYGELFNKYLPTAYRALYGEDLSAWPLMEVPEELLTPAKSEPDRL